MSRGEFFTRFTIWVTLAGYFTGAAVFILSQKRRNWKRAARLAWSIACISLLAHVACAFHYYHGWSQTAAYQQTARQTAEVVGLNWGGGIYINYALMVGWVVDVIWWWRGLDSHRRRPQLLAAIWQAFLIFIIFNATVVFKTGPLRWVGLALCLALVILWLYTSRYKSRREFERVIES